MQILVVEDDRKMAAILRQTMEEEGYRATVTHNGADALAMARAGRFDLILLDVLLPGANGFDVVNRLREEGIGVPVVMLTARDAVGDVVRGLNVGADDYVTKPFSVDELLARVRAALRRGPASQPPVLRAGDLALNPGTREVTRAGQLLLLTRTEFALLETLLRRRGQVVEREALIEHVWGHDAEIESNTLDAFVRLLRAKVDGGRPRSLIRTVRGVGYSIDPAEE